MEFSEFRKRVLKIRDTHNFKVTGSAGVYDAFLWLKRNELLDNSKSNSNQLQLFRKIIRLTNKHLGEELLDKGEIALPYKLGHIELKRREKRIEYKDGKIQSNLPIDWKKTLELWYSDDEAKENKVLIRKDIPVIYRIKYNRYIANYQNKIFFRFSPNRQIKMKLKDRVEQNTVNTLY